ncbi:MAG: hypothetical protein IPN69_09735 [Acidobacteria bacterium]|nr:hypothetical protein [Acidobacteriota bacterium]
MAEKANDVWQFVTLSGNSSPNTAGPSRKTRAAPSAGRWTSPDPYNGSSSVGNPQSWNRYSYVESHPTDFVDPTGLKMAYVCSWWHYVYNGGPNDGEHYEPGGYWLVCKWEKVVGTVTINAGDSYIDYGNSLQNSLPNPITLNRRPLVKTPRENFVDECLKKRVDARVKNLDTNRQNNMEIDLMWSMNTYNITGHIRDFTPEKYQRNKNAAAVSAFLGMTNPLALGPIGSGNMLLLRALREGTTGRSDYLQSRAEAETVTDEDKKICETEATQFGY